ncbi:hypothetical protein [Pedobacter endophyticus]|uniref:Ig-like domain-containing protein n=1 Tax=Pedobacter endophyticus TaxID=2789740 RepID=A0A7S9L2S0_9SPHI|nr:hypothetical protein [Pedobacter endophyticus]QPH41096.1 hypothetical protein IZT61_07495 [Pedobacter endophyticus]
MNTITKTLLAVAFLFICSIYRGSAQVTPTTTGVNLFCQGSDLTLPAPAAGEDWILRYSATQTTTPSTGITLTNGNKVPAADLNTGYYYLTSKKTEAGSCESEMQEIPVYVLKPLIPAFTPAGFCIETPLEQTATVDNPETSITTLAYQWYKVSGGTETAIAGATSQNYTPTTASSTVGTTTYRLKVGYLIGGNKYCPQTIDHDVTITAKPGKPTITVGTANGTAAAVTF